MQNLLKRLTLRGTILAISFLIWACGTQTQPEENADKTAAHTSHESSTEAYDEKRINPAVPLPDVQIQKTLRPTVTHYLRLKDALVMSKADSAVMFAFALATALEKPDTTGMHTASGIAFAKHLQEVKLYSYLIAQQTVLAKQRQFFLQLSQGMYAMLSETGGAAQPLHWQYCPMYKAQGGTEGGYWLSAEKAIMNPYFGDEMLHCGEVQQVLRFD